MKFKFISIILFITLAFSACDEFLLTDSPSSFTDTYIYSNEEDAFKSVKSIYTLFTDDQWVTRMSFYYPCNTDVEMSGASSAPDGTRRDIWTFEANASNTETLKPWNIAYNAINRANECIEGIEKSTLYNDPKHPIMKQLVGEAKALRAFWYLQLVDNWGDVPFKTTPTKAGEDFYLPRTDRDTILAFLVKDLIDIEPFMQWADKLPEGIERINREFVQGFIARLALTRGGYSLRPDLQSKRNTDYLDYYKIANAYCKKMVSLKPRTLTSSFAQVFLNECQFKLAVNEDVIHEIAFKQGTGDVGSWNGIRITAGTHAYGTGGGSIVFPPTYFFSFDTMDVRLPATCALYSFDANLNQVLVSFNGIVSGKWSKRFMSVPQGTASAKGTGINWPLMRYADVLLMLAETENEINNGPTADAIDALKKVRQRAFPSSVWTTKVDNYITTVSAGKDAFFNAIVDERAWEFGGEMIRKHDLIRWNLYGNKIANMKNELTQMGLDANSGTGKYADYPAYIYSKTNPDGTLQIVGKFRKPATEPVTKDVPNVGDNPTGFVKTSWMRTNYDATTSGPATYILYNWRGYKDATGATCPRYILPVHNDIIISSLGVIKNDGYGF